MTTRLDRLVLLLDTGSTQIVRDTAAQQLADVQKSHPDELYNLLGRVVPYLSSKSWETRTSAAKAISGIVQNVEPWNPNEPDVDDAAALAAVPDASTGPSVTLSLAEDLQRPAQTLALSSLSMETVMTKGKRLLGSAGKEYEVSVSDMTPAERMAWQKRNLTSRLGLVGEYMDQDVIDDLACTPAVSTESNGAMSIPKRASPAPRQQPSPGPPGSTATTPDASVAGLSARQRNALKRKAKSSAKSSQSKVRSVEFGSSPAAAAATAAASSNSRRSSMSEDGSGIDVKKEPRNDYFSFTPQPQNDKLVVENKVSPHPHHSLAQAASSLADTHEGRWPFEGLVDLLILEMFDPQWEIRHGASIGLRDVLRFHANEAGRIAGLSASRNTDLNTQRLEDIACRVLCIFALDSFGDYLADQVVAPIRESAAQVLGTLLLHLPRQSVERVFDLLCDLVFQPWLPPGRRVWEACHGGALGLKYLVAVRADVVFSNADILDGVVKAVIEGLAHEDDDVRAVSADTLLPMTDTLVTTRASACELIINVLWDCLADVRDDLSASTSSIMDALSKFFSYDSVIDAMTKRSEQDDPGHSFTELVPRLFPLLRHTIASVRASVVRALTTLARVQKGPDAWIDGHLVQLVYQNIYLEQTRSVRGLSVDLWNVLMKRVSARQALEWMNRDNRLISMLGLLLIPIGTARRSYPVDRALLISTNSTSTSKKTAAHSPDMPVLAGDTELVGFETMLEMRVTASRALGQMLALMAEGADADADQYTVKPAELLLSQTTSTPVILCGFMIQSLASNIHPNSISTSVAKLYDMLLTRLGGDMAPSCGLYANLVPQMLVVKAQCSALLHAFVDLGKVSVDKIPRLPAFVEGESSEADVLNIEAAQRIVNEDYDTLITLISNNSRSKNTLKALQGAKQSAQDAIATMQRVKRANDVRVSASHVTALLNLGPLPKKLNSTIRALMDSVKEEEVEYLQTASATTVVALVDMCLQQKRGGVADKLVTNLGAFYCMDTSETPEFYRFRSQRDTAVTLHGENDDDNDGNQRKTGEGEMREAALKSRGALSALLKLCDFFGPALFSTIPKVESLMFAAPQTYLDSDSTDALDNPESTAGQELVDSFSVWRAICRGISAELHPSLLDRVPHVLRALESPYSIIRYTAARLIAVMSTCMTVEMMQLVIQRVLPRLADAGAAIRRQGAMECVHHIVEELQDRVLPYVIFLIVPTLGRMSDSDSDTRALATTSFALLVKLVPLESGIPDPPGFSAELLQERAKERDFIAQMLDPSKIEHYRIPVDIRAELRHYQQSGVNWLAFLNRYQLHGILCDDMGLGKTLQSICMIASDHYYRAQGYKETGSAELAAIPSLVICPPTLVGHWIHELKTYAPFLNCLAYSGPPAERVPLRRQLSKQDVVVTSYEVCRIDIHEFIKHSWNYCILDEGHIIKNAKSKLTQSVKLLKSNHRVILSGTPIQNNVLELWSLFDFLMPGFLGSERSFHERYARPIAASRDGKSSTKEQERGALALEALHKQVLPFLLRRLKEDVLTDLPPKIIQDYYCDMSPLQKELYDEFVRTQQVLSAGEDDDDDLSQKKHIFQALQYMRKLCNHPALVVTPKHPQYEQLTRDLKQKHSALRSIEHAPKLEALRELLLDCNIGTPSAAAAPNESSSAKALVTGDVDVVSEHRVLIFCQLKDMLDIVEKDLLQALMPTVTYMRLDGSVDSRKRHEVVQKFNADPSIDVLLLTTHVGGLGLNLTGADTVIFVEHDWNPMNDLQAMDRAHRIGQKKVVNVYRLITRGTLEEKIMGLQKFKMNVANTVVNQQNAGLSTMDTAQIFDLFQPSDADVAAAAASARPPGDTAAAAAILDAEGKPVKKGGNVLDGLGELWDDSQYDDFNLDGFISTLKK